MRSFRKAWKLLPLAVAMTLPFYQPGIVGSQSTSTPAEVRLQRADFATVKDQLFGPGGLLAQNRPFELKAQNVVLTQQQFQDFFFPAQPKPGSPPQQPKDFATLVGQVQQRPGTEVKLQGVVEVPGTAGMVNRIPFEAKVEAGEVKLEGLRLTQAEFNKLVERLQGIAGAREVKVEALVDGRRVEFENGKVETKIEAKDKSRGRAEEKRHRGEQGTSSTLNNERARDRGKDLDHSIRGRERATLEHERHERMERERVERAERAEKVERAERPERRERIERAERPERVERMERPERIERAERPERPERIERAERPERVERAERPERRER